MTSQDSRANNQNKQSQSGFAIILVMGLLLVAAAITATLIARQENETVWAPIEGTQTQIASIQKAMAAYERKNHRLPLPAPRTTDGGLVLHTEATSLISEESAGAGAGTESKAPAAVEQALKDGATAVESDGGIAFTSNPAAPDAVVVIGAIPTETLGLPRTAAEDAYGRLLTYAVTLAATNAFTYESTEGAINLDDAAGNQVAEKLSYIVLAHGKEGAGAWNAKTRFKGRECSGEMNASGGATKNGEVTPKTEAGGTVSDQSNCDENDATFILHDVTLVAGEGFFDDQILKGEKDPVALTSSKPCPAQTVTWGDGNDCSADIPDPGVMHYASSQQPTSVHVTVGGDNCPPCPDGENCMAVMCKVGGGAIGEVDVTCNNGEIVLANATCEVQVDACDLPWGGTIANGETVTAFSDATPCKDAECKQPWACADEVRTCTNGVLSGSYTNQQCNIPVVDCTTPWGATVADGDSIDAYTTAGDGSKECVTVPTSHTCTAGSFVPAMESWSAAATNCPAVACDLPWGGTLADGGSVTAYMHQDCISKAACISETRTCTGGVLSGSYTQQTDCRDHCPVSCSTPWGTTVANGNSVTSYGTYDTGAKGSPCDEQVHTCSYGSFDVDIGARSQSCECVPDEKGGGCDGSGVVDAIEAFDAAACVDGNNNGVSNGQCGFICSESGDEMCAIGGATAPARCSNGTMHYDASCPAGGGGGK